MDFIVWALVAAFVARLVWFLWDERKEKNRSAYWSHMKPDIRQAAEQIRTMRNHWERTTPVVADYVLRGPVPRRSESGHPPRQMLVALAVLMEIRTRAKHLKPVPPDDRIHASYLAALDAAIAQAQSWSGDAMHRTEDAWIHFQDELAKAKDSDPWNSVPPNSFRRTRLAVFFLGTPR